MGKPLSPWGSWALTVCVLLSACTGAGASKGPFSRPSSGSSEVSTTPSPAGAFVRACEDNVYGDLGRDWRARSVVVGPIAFVGLPYAATAPLREFVPDKDGFKSVKALVVVDRGAEVTVSVPPTEQGHLALVYDPAVFNTHQIADGETTVTFRACAKGEGQWPGPTQFNGGFIVDGPRCATIVVLDGHTGLMKRVNIPFGRGTCATAG